MPFPRDDPTALASGLPAPVDDGAADHLPGVELPPLAFPATTGSSLSLRDLSVGTLVLFLFPRIGAGGIEPLPGWDEIPGARGCTPQAAGFRDRSGELDALGARVAGLSAQPPGELREAAERLGLALPLLSDPELRLAGALRLPTFDAAGMRLYTRLTLVARRGRVERAFYPVFPPDRNAEEVLAWLREEAAARR